MIARETNTSLAKIIKEVFGLQNVRSFRLDAAVDKLPTLTVERYVTAEETQRLYQVLQEYLITVEDRRPGGCALDITTIGGKQKKFTSCDREAHIPLPNGKNVPVVEAR